MTRRPNALFVLLLVLSFILPAVSASAQSDDTPSFVLATWNIQSGQSDPATIARQIGLFDGVDIWLLQEVNSRETSYYVSAAEDGEGVTFDSVMSSAGDGNHLLTLYNEDRFELVQGGEVAQVNTTGNARPALVVQLRDRGTGTDFLVMNNHLYSSREDQRIRQADILLRWGQQQTLPVIAGGDMNFEAKNSDPSYLVFTEDGAWNRIAPENDGPTRPNGRAIDHIFVAGDARDWPVSAQIVERENDLDNENNSDHRPVLALVGPEVAMPLVPCSTLAQECLVEPSLQSAEPTQVDQSAQSANTVTVTSASVNLRGGAGTNFPIVGSAKLGDVLTVTGGNADGSWLQLAGGAWIAAFLVSSVQQSTSAATASRSGATIAVSTPVQPLPAVQPVQAAVQPTPVPPPAPTSVPQRSVTAGGLVIIALDKRAEYAVIRNNSGSAVDLGGWVLLSEKGNQACALGGVIEAGAQLTISALGDIAGFNCGFGGNIWNNSERDPAALIAPDGTVVSRYE